MNSLPTVVDYQAQVDNNNDRFAAMLISVFPDLDTDLMLQTFNVVSYLHETKVNAQILPRVIRGVHNIMIGTGMGQVVVHVQGESTNVSVRETDQELKTKQTK